MDGSFCEDELTAEYYGGVLASSRTGINRDDRGATYLEQISHLSIYQIRTHFIVYTVLRELFRGTQLKVGNSEDRYNMRSYIPVSDYNRAMAFSEHNEDSYFAELCAVHSFSGLYKNELICATELDSADGLRETDLVLKYPEDGIRFQPTISGVEFYLWGIGRGDLACSSFLTTEISIEVPKCIEIPTNAFAIIEEFERQEQSAKSQ